MKTDTELQQQIEAYASGQAQPLATNPIVTSLQKHLTTLHEQQSNQPLGKRGIGILIALGFSSIVAIIGSLTFLVGRQFPDTFAALADIDIKPEVSEGLGEFLAWANVVVEAIFYIWTISRLLPPFKPLPEETQVKSLEPESGWLNHVWSTIRPSLPNKSEWVLATASAIPLTFVSLLDQEKENRAAYATYGIVIAIASITLVSNKFFLSLTHQQFKAVWSWWRHKPLPVNATPEQQVKAAVVSAACHAQAKLQTLSVEEIAVLIKDLKTLAQPMITDIEIATRNDYRWLSLLEIMFTDLSKAPAVINKKAIFLVPAVGIFAALSWLGVIATVPNGVAQKLSSSTALQYSLMVIAGIPLLEIGLSLGGTFGLQLSQLGNGLKSLVTQITNSTTRWLGYVPIIALGLASFSTNATLTLQEFGSIPALAWSLLPSATLGINLINIISGIELWHDALIAINGKRNSDKKLLITHAAYLTRFIETVNQLSPDEIKVVALCLDQERQKKLLRLIPDQAKAEFELESNINPLKSYLRLN